MARRRWLVLLTLVAALAVALVGLPPTAGPAAAAPPDATVRWSPCGDGLECAIAKVPLDPVTGDGGAIQIALARRPAADPANRLGSLFINPGGPGGSGVDVVRAIDPALLPEGVARYDLVGFDPRGVIASTPLRCFGNMRQAEAALPPFVFPVTDADVIVQHAADQRLADACDQRARRILDQMTTAEVAHDLDRLRAAVGDERLNFLGLSYGSYLGATYANLYPDRVGAMVLDGVLDPVAWATGHGDDAATLPFSARLGSDQGAQDTLGELFRLCEEAGPPACLLAPGAAARFDALADRVREQPIALPLPDGTELLMDYSLLVGATLSTLYEPFAWPEWTALLALLETGAPPAALGTRYAAAMELVSKRRLPNYLNLVENFAGVGCADTDNPSHHSAWAEAATARDAATDGYFGSPWTWVSSACAVWPGTGHNRYTGPWSATTATPVLLVNPRFDPATPLAGARALESLLPSSRLLTYEGWGHVALGRSACVDQAISDYLMTRQLPPEGASCPAAPSPFALLP